MKRTVAVTFGGIVITLLLVSLGTWAVLSQSPAWKVVVTGAHNSNEPFDTLMVHLSKMVWTIIGLVYIPAALLVGLLVGLFSNRHKMSCAIVASCPAWTPPLFTTPRTALISGVIAGVAVLGAWLSEWVSGRIHPATQGNITS